MKKSSIRVIIGLMSFALIGVVAMQLYFLMQSYNMQSKIFDRSVSEALDNVVSKLSRRDADNFLKQKIEHHNQLKSQVIASTNELRSDSRIEEKKIILDGPVKAKKHLTARERQLAVLRDSLRKMIRHQTMDDAMRSLSLQVRIEQFTDEFGEVHMRYIPMVTNVPISQKHKLQKYDTLRYYYQDPQFGNQVMSQIRINPLWVADQQRKLKERQMRQVKQLLMADSMQNLQAHQPNVMLNIYEEYQRSGEPLAKRLDMFWVDSLLRFEMHNKGIYLPFSYEVTNANGDSVIYSKALDVKGDRPVFDKDAYQTRIFSKEVINDPGLIRMSFPQKSSWILSSSSMTVTMAVTGALLVLLVICFGYTLFSIIRQKKISEMRTDFINNMTHEFKTPVSTIMIASEALKDSEMATDKNRIARLANIIYEENERLGSHIERVLNIARIDKNDFKLERKPLDVNDMVTVVLDSMALKLQKCDADVVLELDAENAIINADELHFSNVLYNLIDNAIKYSGERPQITISTANKNGHVIVKVADKGIGMSRDQQTKIFEQFYRIPTGNVHNVKGFGLGLSYVNTIVKRLNGTINVRSEKDKGSEFELRFQGA